MDLCEELGTMNNTMDNYRQYREYENVTDEYQQDLAEDLAREQEVEDSE